MNTEYIKDYKNKELKQYVLAYLLITISSVGFYTWGEIKIANVMKSLFGMVTIDLLVGAICALVFVLNELWSDKLKTKIIYRTMPSDTVFSDIASGKIDAVGFDIAKAQNMYSRLSNAPANEQTAQWNILLGKSRTEERGNVIEAERMQLLTRDMCIATISLIVMTLITFIAFIFVFEDVWIPTKILLFPFIYLVVMFFVTRAAAQNRAKRLVAMVIKNDVLTNVKNKPSKDNS